MKHRLLILLADSESEPYDILKLYDLDYKHVPNEAINSHFDCVNYSDGYYDTYEDRKNLINEYFDTFGFKAEYEAKYLDVASEDLRASYPTYEMALTYFKKGKPIEE